MDAFTRLAIMHLLGELLTGQKGPDDVQKAFVRIVGDEKTRSYELGIKDARTRWTK